MVETRARFKANSLLICELEKKQQEKQVHFTEAELMANPIPEVHEQLFGEGFEANFDHYHNVREIEAEHYQIPPNIITLIQQGSNFYGSNNEDPNAHIREFLMLCNVFKLQGITQDAVRRTLFPFTLKGKARAWFEAVDGHMFETFEEMKKRFVTKYFPPEKVEQLKAQIRQFRQEEGESFTAAWERFQELLKRGPRGMFENNQELWKFHQGLNKESHNLVIASAGGDINGKTMTQMKELYQTLANNFSSGAMVERDNPQKNQSRMLELNSADQLEAKMTIILQKLNKLEAKHEGKSHIVCGLCQENHHTNECEQLVQPVNFVKNQGGWNNQFQDNRYNQGRNQQGYSWNHNPKSSWQNPGQSSESATKAAFDETNERLEHLITLSETQQKFNNDMQKRMDDQDQKIKVVESGKKIMEHQLGQIASDIQKLLQNSGGLPSSTVQNPKGKEQCNAIILRSGREIQSDTEQPQLEEGVHPEESSANEKSENADQKQKTQEEKKKQEAEEDKDIFNQKTLQDLLKPPMPYPSRLKKKNFQGQKCFDSFLQLLRNLKCNLSLLELLTNFPQYTKFIKELVTNKEKYTEEGMVPVSSSCSCIIRRNPEMPEKVSDPGSCTISITIEGRLFKKALCDLGSGVSLMPLSVAESLGLKDAIQPAPLTLQLADRSIVVPDGIIKDVCVGVDDFFLPVDFVVLKMKEDKELPLILGRPFLATGNATILVKQKAIIFKINGEEIAFKMENADTDSRGRTQCCQINEIDDIDECVLEIMTEEIESKPDFGELERYLFIDSMEEESAADLETPLGNVEIDSRERMQCCQSREIDDINECIYEVMTEEFSPETDLVKMEKFLFDYSMEASSPPDFLLEPIRNFQSDCECKMMNSEFSKECASQLVAAEIKKEAQLNTPVIDSARLQARNEKKLLKVFEECKTASKWFVDDNTGIRLSAGFHRDHRKMKLIQLLKSYGFKEFFIQDGSLFKLLLYGLL